jgi:transglutaminase-like putative cysteine protease
MRTPRFWCLALLLTATPLWAQTPNRVVLDVWNTASFEGARAGYVHTLVRETEQDGHKVYSTTTELKLTLQRNQGTVQLRLDTGSVETADGKVLGVAMRIFQGDQPQVTLKGTVKGGQLEVSVNGKTQLERKIPWNDQVIGLYRQERLFQERKVKPGDQFSYLSYEPTYNVVVTNRVRVLDEEEVNCLSVKKTLLRVETVPDKIEVPGTSVQLPTLVSWLDKELRPVRSEFELPLLGTVTLHRTTKAEATKPPERAKIDVLRASLVPVQRVIEQPNETRSAVYRIRVKGEKQPETAFVQDGRQTCKNVKGDTFELHVQSQPRKDTPEEAIDVQYLKSCQWLDSDNTLIRRYAREAIGPAKDPWEKAQRIEKWVHGHMRVSFTEDFVPASEVAGSLRGDCRQHAMLTTALCRAAGVPSRTALGLVYAVDRQRGPVMVFHMWTEVAIKGRWLPIDATRGEGHVGATHLKIADHSWYDTPSLTPLLPVHRVLGKLSIEVLRVDDKE